MQAVQRQSAVSWVTCSLAASMLGGLFVPALLAGDPIRFSTTGKKLETPRQNPLEQYLNRPFESLKPESSLEPVVGPAINLVPQRPVLPDKNDQNDYGNSWIWRTPESLIRQKTAEEVFNLQRTGPDGRPKKLSLMEEYFQQREQKMRPNSNQLNKGDDASGDMWDKERKSSDPFDSKDNALFGKERSLNSLFTRGKTDEWGKSSDRSDPLRGGDLTLSDLFNNLRTQAKKDREDERRDREFKEMLDNRNFWSPLSERKDPLNLQDGGNDNLPSAMREMENLIRQNRRDILSGGAPSGLGASRPGPFAEAPSRLQLTPTPAASQNPSTDPVKQRERPMVLPIPKPNF